MWVKHIRGYVNADFIDSIQVESSSPWPVHVYVGERAYVYQEYSASDADALAAAESLAAEIGGTTVIEP